MELVNELESDLLLALLSREGINGRVDRGDLIDLIDRFRFALEPIEDRAGSGEKIKAASVSGSADH